MPTRATFVSHSVQSDGLRIEATTGRGLIPDVEVFVPREEAEQFGWVDQQEGGEGDPASSSLPDQYTLQCALESSERAVCTSALFIIVVQDRGDLGGGYGVTIIALTNLIGKHFDALEDVEMYLDKHTPYAAHSAVWVPLPHYNARKREAELLKNITAQEATQ